MRLGIITVGVLLGMALNVRAEENVMVDLSVLDGLNTSYIAPTQPLFPILPKKNRISAPVKINKPALPVKMKPQPEENRSVAKEQPKEVVISPKEEAKEEVVVVDVEPISPKVNEPAKAIEIKPSSEVKAEIKPQVKPEDALLPQPEEKVEAATQEPLKDDTVSSEPNLVPQADEQAPDVSEDTVKPALLVDEKILSEPTMAEDASAVIKFAPGIDTLSPEQMSQIKAVVAGFKDTEKNKIAIYSYNQDDGVDSFKKKRISLNRAIEVRSYLIKQGYKNFSIKVVNINSGSDKTDMVELKEI